MFTPVLAKPSKSFNLIDTLSVGADRIQRNFEPLQRQVEMWRKTQLTDERAKLIFYNAFIDGALDAPRSLAAEVHRLYFEPEFLEFSARTMWSLSNAFSSAFKKLEPIPQFKATAKLGAFLHNCRHNQAGPFRVAITPNGSAWFQYDERLGDPDPSSKFLETRLWIASPTICPELPSDAKGSGWGCVWRSFPESVAGILDRNPKAGQKENAKEAGLQ